MPLTAIICTCKSESQGQSLNDRLSLEVAKTAGRKEPAPPHTHRTPSLGAVFRSRVCSELHVQVHRLLWILDALGVSCTDGTQSLAPPSRLGPEQAQLGLAQLAHMGRQLSLSFSLPLEAGCGFSSQSTVPLPEKGLP